MSEKNAPFDLCFKVLQRLHKSGALHEMVLVGSWCAYFYKDYFESGWDYSALRTRDMDFLIATPPKIKRHVSVPDLLNDLGFIVDMHQEGYMRLDHPELIIDFLVPEKGRGSEGPYNVKNLGVKAQPLRYMNLLLDNTITVHSHGFELTLPHPIDYSFHKFLVSPRRKEVDKRLKDHRQALDVLRMVMNTAERGKIKRTFDSFPAGWRKTILSGLKQSEDQDIIDPLKA